MQVERCWLDVGENYILSDEISESGDVKFLPGDDESPSGEEESPSTYDETPSIKDGR